MNGEVLDLERVLYYRLHLQSAARAVAEGLPLKGYFIWSLLDNFEWGLGYSERCGFHYVDYATQKRIRETERQVLRRLHRREARGVEEKQRITTMGN